MRWDPHTAFLVLCGALLIVMALKLGRKTSDHLWTLLAGVSTDRAAS